MSPKTRCDVQLLFSVFREQPGGFNSLTDEILLHIILIVMWIYIIAMSQFSLRIIYLLLLLLHIKPAKLDIQLRINYCYSMFLWFSHGRLLQENMFPKNFNFQQICLSERSTMGNMLVPDNKKCTNANNFASRFTL